MASVIIQKPAPGGGGDQAISMSNSSWARPVVIPSNWSKLRVGVRMWITDIGTGPTSLPYFALGLCNGTTNLIGDATTTYFVGVVTNTSAWSYSGTPNFVYFSINTVPCTKSGSNLLSGSNITTDVRFSSTGSIGTMFFVDITKGSPNYTFTVWGAIASVPSNASSTTFQQQMPLSSPSFTGYSFGTSQTIAVNETLSGSLNAVSCWWNRSDLNVEIQDLSLAILS